MREIMAAPFDDVFRQHKSAENIQKYVNNIINYKNKLGKAKQDKDAKTWLSWARSHRFLRTVLVDVPAGILPKDVKGKLYDVKVSSRGPDDIVYDKNKDIRQKVARGNCFLEVTDKTGTSVRCVTFALKKFTGGLGDDDDRDLGDGATWKKYFLQPLESSTRVVCTRKANGEAAHLSAVRIGGENFICCGSKNVHMIVRNRGDISKYEGDRYAIASEVCSTIFDTLEGMSKEESDILIDFLCETELTGVFEILNPTHQHVENFSHMTRPEIKFLVWTTFNTLHEEDEELSCMPPHVAIDTAAALGLSTVQYDIIAVAEVDARMTQVRKGYGFEGEVLYFCDESDSVIGLLKKKTIWYIICRAIREKLRAAVIANEKNPGTFSIAAYHRKVHSRILEIKKWLGLDDECAGKWKALGVDIMTWVIDQHSHSLLQRSDISDQFPVLWSRFLEERNLSDRIDSDCRDADCEDCPDGPSVSTTEGEGEGASS